MQFENISKNVIRVEGFVATQIAKGPGVRHLTDQYVDLRTESGKVVNLKTRVIAAEIDAGARFEVDEAYAAPRLMQGKRYPGPLEELVGCPGCEDRSIDYMLPTMSGPQKVRKHLEHPVCLPVDEAERAIWLQVPTPQRDPNRISEFERQTQLLQEQAALKDENDDLRKKFDELQAQVAQLLGQKQKTEKGK